MDIAKIDEGLGVASVAGAVIGGTAGAAVTEGVTVAEATIDAIHAETTTHGPALAKAANAVSALTTAAAPVISSLPKGEAQKAVMGLSFLETILADLKSIFKI
ncbi:hypothetical protein [Acidocella sp.]|uniref:hypothetical protein n=1 Tax=Acidocella sp. TaxID=50710 RepID=UPI00262AC6F4|nr:hypothetical protein [Acidocella sp.]